MDNKFLLNVIIPVYNCERYLAEAIESVLNQTYDLIEVIVVDDGSTDTSANVAKQFVPPVRYYYQPNNGIAAARNRGVDLAQGDFLAFLDSDDVWTPDKLKIQVATFEDNPKLEAVFGHVQQFISPELDDNMKKKIRCPSDTMPGFCPDAMLIRRSSFMRVGPFDPQWKVGQFEDWYSKAIEKGLKFVMLPDLLVKRRLHQTNMGILERDSRADYCRILKAALDRRRNLQT
ncbi:glycosyltransferase family 2 protein [Thermodesulfobacteriota bacterium]